MGTYEIQVLDSYQNQTYADGQAGALYGRSKPLVNASRKPGEWQSYDIIFHRPLFDKNGKLKSTFIGKQKEITINESLAKLKNSVNSGEEILNNEFSAIKANKNHEISPRSHG